MVLPKSFRLLPAHWLKWIPAGLWALTMIGLPLTSFPLITRVTGATVAPFSAIPLILLAGIWFVPFLARGGRLPKEIIPIVIFALYVIILAALAFFQIDWTFRNRPLFDQTLRTFIPFGMGLLFLFVTSAWQKDQKALVRTLQLIQVGGIIMLVWAIAQALVVFRANWQYPKVMEMILTALVTQSNMTGNPRLSGLTWEASWFAHQLNMLYLPLWLAASYQKTSVFPKLWKISLENVCLVAGMVVFFLTSPRIGGAAFMLMLLFLFLKINIAIYRWIIQKLAETWASFRRLSMVKIGVGILVIVGFVSIYVVFSYGVFKIVSERDWRVGLIANSPLSSEELRRVSALDENSLYYLGLRFAFLERTVYWMTGWHIFNDYPILGVGLGNAGYYFLPRLPAIGWSSIEIRAMAYQNEGLPNIKSVWHRLMGETGIIGFSIFVAWLLGLWVSFSRTLRSRDRTLKTVALAGQLALLAYVFEGFSVDTFGLPYLFVITGLGAAAALLYRQKLAARP